MTCKVTSLAPQGPGSLQHCVDQPGPRVVVFDVSGVIPGPITLRHGQLTLAGQSSPGGVVIDGGVICDNVYDPYDCNDVIVRHLRARRGRPDSFRIGGAHDVILDHVSLASAEDEILEITRSRRVTIQHSILAEPAGEHYEFGGVLINYSKDTLPLDELSLHHNLWNGVWGRLPEMSCEENPDGPGKTNCSGHTLRIELTNNVLWDVRMPVWYNRCTSNNGGNDCAPSAQNFFLALNWINNLSARRTGTDTPAIEPHVASTPNNKTFAQGNVLRTGTTEQEAPLGGPSLPARHAFPPVTLLPTKQLIGAIQKLAGALPRDPMDARLVGYLSQPVDQRPAAWVSGQGIDQGDSLRLPPARPAQPDLDGDGMPDAWEQAHGLDPARNDAASPLGERPTGIPGCTQGYTAIECYLNELALLLER